MNKEECMLAIAYYNSLFALQCMEGKYKEAENTFLFLKDLHGIRKEIKEQYDNVRDMLIIGSCF